MRTSSEPFYWTIVINPPEMNKAQEYSSHLIDELYESTPAATFDLVTKRMDLAVRIDKVIKKGLDTKAFCGSHAQKTLGD